MAEQFQAHPNVTVTFAHLRDVAMRKGWTTRMHIFDCGHYVAVYDEQGKQIISKTWRCDEDDMPDGASQCAGWLIERGKLTFADFDAN